MKNQILLHRGALLATVALVVSGCATTGDPNQGGLFGWSAGKADTRSAAYRAQFQQANSQLESEESESIRLKRQQKKLASSIDSANAELSQMLMDVRGIEKSGGTQLASKAASVRARIEETKDASNPDEQKIHALRREVDSLREEMRLLQQRQ